VLIAMALMTGLQKELRERIVGSSAHVYVFKPAEGITDVPAEVARLRQIPRVIGAAPAVIGKGLLSVGNAQAPVTIKGVDAGLEPSVTDIRQAIRQGSLDGLRVGPEERDGIVLGIDLAKTLNVEIGDVIHLVTPDQILGPFTTMPRMRAFKVTGIFSLGLFEFDSEYALVDLAVAQRVFGREHPDFMQVRLDDMFAATAVAADIQQRLGDQYATEDWAQMNKSLFSALWLEKLGLSIAVALVVIVGALNIISSLILMVMQKSRDIAILKTMGASARSVMVIFIAQGTAIGIVGTAIGGLGGVVLSWVLNYYKVVHIPIDVYQVAYVPFIVLLPDFLIVVVSAIGICFLSTIYPSRQAARLDPVQALRVE